MTLEDIAKRLDRLETLTALSAKTVLDINDTAELTGYSVKYLRLLIAKREIPHYRRGNRLYFSRDEIEDWMMGVRIPTKEEMNIKAMGYRPSKTNQAAVKEWHYGQGHTGLKASMSSGSTPHTVTKATTEPRGQNNNPNNLQN